MASECPESTASFRNPSEERLEQASGVEGQGRSLADSRVGSVLGERFELLRLLGVGSYGYVYEARDRQNPKSTLAVKLLRYAGAQALYRFKREFRSLAEVSRPNLVAMHELFLDETDAFFTMELVRGGDILSYVRPDNVLDEGRLRSALRGLAAGVSALHDFGRLHRDLKPSNVLVDETGRVVIVDFGLAIMRDEAESGRADAGFAGTALYAGPEPLTEGRAGTERDWYAVGTMLYEALSGRVPYDAPLMKLGELNRAPPVPLSDLPPALATLGELCMRMLAPASELRAGPAALLDALGEPPVRADSIATPRELRLVGRRAELSLLHEAFAEVEQGARRCTVVLGASGLGKTALVDHFLEELRSSGKATVLRGRCYVNEDVPYRAVDGLIDALSHHLLELSPGDCTGLVPRDVQALAQLFPVLMRVPSVAWASPMRFPSAEEQLSVRDRGMRALRELLARLSDRLPTVLFIDDLQWD